MKAHWLPPDVTELTYEIIDRKTYLLPDGPELVMDVVRRAVPLVLLDFAESECEATAQAIIDFGVTHSFVGRDSPYIRLLERYARYIPAHPSVNTTEQVVLWRNHRVRIRNKFSVQIWGNRVDSNSRPARHKMLIDIFVTE